MKNKVINFLYKKLKWNITKITAIEKLGGLSSENFKVIYKNKSYFVKLCSHTYLHTDRKNEIQVINNASEINLCNKPIYYSIKTGNMVSPWLKGNIPTEDDFKSITYIRNLASSLKKLHNLSCDKYFDPFKDIKIRIEVAKKEDLPLPKYIDNLLEVLSTMERKLNNNLSLGLCHNDLNCSNTILFENKVYFVDFEYSAIGDIFYDLANISWFLEDNLKKELLKEYFGYYNEKHYKKLNQYLFVVKLYNATWSLLKSNSSTSDYDYLNGATLIFKDLYDNYLISFTSECK